MKKSFAFSIVLLLSMIFGFKQNVPGKYNVLFIIADDLRPELGAFGADFIKSPNFDKLANESAVFPKAFCNVPVCGASRASLLSGIRPGKFRFYSHSDYLNEHYPGAKSIPRIFKENGYSTISNGKIFHQKKDEASAWDEIWQASSTNGFDYVTKQNIDLISKVANNNEDGRGLPYEIGNVDDEGYKDGKMAKKIVSDLKAFKKSGKPFFLTAGFHKPHLPFNAPKKYWDMYDASKIHLPANYLRPESTPQVAFHKSGELRTYFGVPDNGLVSDSLANTLLHGYYACVSYVDAQLGIIMDELKKSGQDKNTIIVLIGDHGWNLGDHQMWNKHCNFSSSLTTPLMIKIPGQTKGQRINNIVEFIDIFPTLTELTGLPLPQTASGESIVPLIMKGTRKKDFAITKWRDGTTIIKENYFYTEWTDDNDKRTDRMLFDHETDPLELNNLAESPKYAVVVNDLSQLMRKNRGEDFFVDRRKTKK